MQILHIIINYILYVNSKVSIVIADFVIRNGLPLNQIQMGKKNYTTYLTYCSIGIPHLYSSHE